jgi:subtilisin family serine protease
LYLPIHTNLFCTVNAFYKILTVSALCISGGLCVLWFLEEPEVNSVPAVQTDANSNNLSTGLPVFTDSEAEDFKPALPTNAVPGERVIHFSNREEYLRYLKELSDSGLSPLSTIDSLLAIRVSEDVLSQLNPTIYGGQERFSYQIERPLPPVDLNPELLAQLRAFGASPRAIVGGLVEGDGSGVMVAILDSGIEANSYFDEVNIDSIDLTSSGISGSGSGHGTAVASIVAGREGIAPAADLLVVRVLDDQGIGSSFDVAEGIVRAVDLGAQFINLSLGVYQDTQVLREAVLYAQSQGVVLVAAAGNDGYGRLPYPAAYPQVLSVTAVDGLQRQAVFPNQSKAIDFAAPGVGILAAGEEAGTQLFSGTSAAAPFVTGTLVALLSADSTLSPQKAVKLLERYLDDAGAAGLDPTYGGGLLNWDRLRERTTTDVSDVALASIYLQPDAQPGTTMPIEVTVQNRGTRWLTAAELTILVGEAEPLEFTVGTLAPGQTTTRKVHTQVPTMQSGETLQIAARVLAEDASGDVRPDNNVKAVFFKPLK